MYCLEVPDGRPFARRSRSPASPARSRFGRASRDDRYRTKLSETLFIWDLTTISPTITNFRRKLTLSLWL